MKVLLIGGPRFIGLHMIESALAAGHEVTMFNRGLTNPDLYPDVERIQGDRERDEDLAKLKGRQFDAVFDTCGYDHRTVQKTLDVLKDSAGHYTFVSSISVYEDFRVPRREEDPKAQLLGDPDVPMERSYGGSAHYGPLKVLAEEAVAKAFPGRWVSIRLTLGVGPNFSGPGSPTVLTYWAKRVRDYDSVLVPGPPTRPVNFIDVRDLADFVVHGAENQHSGPYNLAAPPLSIRDMLTLFMGLYDNRPELVFADPDWLLAEGVPQNTAMPWWITGDDHLHHFGVDGNKAVRDGLRIRPFEASIRDSVEWDDTRPDARAAQSAAGSQAGETLDLWAGPLSRQRELELIELWRSGVAVG
jgi:2'-hydroxyisoflavone reductase